MSNGEQSPSDKHAGAELELVVRQAVIDWNRAQRPIPLDIDGPAEGGVADAVLSALRARKLHKTLIAPSAERSAIPEGWKIERLTGKLHIVETYYVESPDGYRCTANECDLNPKIVLFKLAKALLASPSSASTSTLRTNIGLEEMARDVEKIARDAGDYNRRLLFEVSDIVRGAASSHARHSVSFEKWLSYQPHLEDHGPLPITRDPMYTVETVRGAWAAGAASELPPIEEVSAAVHAAWMESKRAQGVTTRKAEDGEELMVPYEQLSEKAKQLDRCSVQAVYAAIKTPIAASATRGRDRVE